MNGEKDNVSVSNFGGILGIGPGNDFHLVMRPDNMKHQEWQKALEAAYAIYPRKMGKSQGMRSARAQCKTIEKVTELISAISNYNKHLVTSNTEPQFVLYFSTFMNQWKDWLDPEQGKVTLTKKGPALNPEAFE